MVHEMRVCFSKNAPVIKVVVDNDDHIPSNSQNPPEEFEIKESQLVELRVILESFVEDILWIYYLKLLNVKIVHLFLVSCKKSLSGKYKLIIFCYNTFFWSHLLNLAIMRVMMEESWLILKVRFIWKMNK